MSTRRTYAELRSARWTGPSDMRLSGHRSRTVQTGYRPEDWNDKPTIAILKTWFEAQPGRMLFRDRAGWVKRGILHASGFLKKLPALSLSKKLVKPDEPDAARSHRHQRADRVR
ncbi:hypothetical protein E4191_18170 (plasmid) [Paracoccus liaowanqingii]|uniref:Uncharacterized protein n=1 Tax=Paracoccus liaowanqingii TaxID=2560053 RepID=A0A4Y5ST54_9RHOB|nr:hypothetical protein [Paracoccus liaowanqingii]QDA36058.1 hypothetical protein E4191_18170 [Paracoccus liaowanqingii]